MNYMKKVGISLLYFFGFVVVATLFMTILNYFNLIGKSIVSIFQIIIPILSIIISGYIFGKKCLKKGWIEGLKLSLIIIIILIILNVILKNNFQLKNLIYYFILMFSCTIGSIIGINKRTK